MDGQNSPAQRCTTCRGVKGQKIRSDQNMTQADEAEHKLKTASSSIWQHMRNILETRLGRSLLLQFVTHSIIHVGCRYHRLCCKSYFSNFLSCSVFSVMCCVDVCVCRLMTTFARVVLSCTGCPRLSTTENAFSCDSDQQHMLSFNLGSWWFQTSC